MAIILSLAIGSDRKLEITIKGWQYLATRARDDYGTILSMHFYSRNANFTGITSVRKQQLDWLLILA